MKLEKWQWAVVLGLVLVLGYILFRRDGFEASPILQPVMQSLSPPDMQPLSPPAMQPLGPTNMQPLSPSKSTFDPSGSDLCTWFVDGYDDMPSKYQEIVYSACKDYQKRCNPGQVWGEIHSIWNSKDRNFAKIASRLNSDDCAPLVKCSEGAQCISYYTGTHCVDGYCN